MNIEQAVLNNLRTLPPDKQQQILDFAEFLQQKVRQTAQPSREGVESSSSTESSTQLSLQEIARLPVAERHRSLASSIAATAEDFATDPELTEFSVLDGEDWEEYDN